MHLRLCGYFCLFTVQCSYSNCRVFPCGTGVCVCVCAVCCRHFYSFHHPLPVFFAPRSVMAARKLSIDWNVWKWNHLKFIFHETAHVIASSFLGCDVLCVVVTEFTPAISHFLLHMTTLNDKLANWEWICSRVCMHACGVWAASYEPCLFQSVIKNGDIVNLLWKLKYCVEMRRLRSETMQFHQIKCIESTLCRGDKDELQLNLAACIFKKKRKKKYSFAWFGFVKNWIHNQQTHCGCNFHSL